MNLPVFDLHCDTALALLGENYRGCGSLRKNAHHIDLERASKLAGYAQCFACFTTTEDDKIPAVEKFERELATILREVENNNDLIRQAFTADEVVANQEEGFMSAVLSIEGPAGFGFDPALLEDLYRVGFRMTTLGWNENNPLTGSHVTGGGLTDLGREYVIEAQRLGMIVDVSHISDQGFWDIMDISTAPVVASHSNSRAVWGVSRNLTDDMFLEICRIGGVVGINQFANFLGGKPSLDTVCDHILHFMKLDPNAEHIALGGDLDGCDALADGFTGVESYQALADKLLSRGVNETKIKNIYWNNALGVMKRCCT